MKNVDVHIDAKMQIEVFIKWVSESLDYSHTGVTKIEDITEEISVKSLRKNPNNKNGFIMGRMISRLQETCSDIFAEINASQESREDFLFLDITKKLQKIFERMGFSEKSPDEVCTAIAFLSSVSLNWEKSNDAFKEKASLIFEDILINLVNFHERQDLFKVFQQVIEEREKKEQSFQNDGHVIHGTGFLGGNVVGQA